MQRDKESKISTIDAHLLRGNQTHIGQIVFGACEITLTLGDECWSVKRPYSPSGYPPFGDELLKELSALLPQDCKLIVCGTCAHFRFSGMAHDMSSGWTAYCGFAAPAYGRAWFSLFADTVNLLARGCAQHTALPSHPAPLPAFPAAAPPPTPPPTPPASSYQPKGPPAWYVVVVLAPAVLLFVLAGVVTEWLGAWQSIGPLAMFVGAAIGFALGIFLLTRLENRNAGARRASPAPPREWRIATAQGTARLTALEPPGTFLFAWSGGTRILAPSEAGALREWIESCPAREQPDCACAAHRVVSEIVG